MNTFSQVPPGFRFHPTDEELVDYYLRKKVNSRPIELDVIKDIDLYKIEPWDLQELCRLGTEDQNEWYFFSHKDKKYPTGTRTNRATTAGFWKATGRDKAIYLKQELIGMRKTLVFYKGRAPNGQKSDWIMHEYRLESDENGSPQEEGWAVCRVFKKKMTTVRRMNEHESPCWFDDQVSYMPNLDNSPNQTISYQHRHPWYPCKKEADQHHHQPHHQYHPRMHYNQNPHDHFLHLPHLDATNKPNPNNMSFDNNAMMLGPFEDHHMQHLGSHEHGHSSLYQYNNAHDQQTMATDWKMLDKYVASQLSHEDLISDENNNDDYSNAENEMFQLSGDHEGFHEEDDTIVSDPMQQDLEHQSACPIDLWK